MSRAEKWVAGILAGIIAAGVPAGLSAYVSLASAQATTETRVSALERRMERIEGQLGDVAWNLALLCERSGAAGCRSGADR